jgi:hypothetical protein
MYCVVRVIIIHRYFQCKVLFYMESNDKLMGKYEMLYILTMIFVNKCTVHLFIFYILIGKATSLQDRSCLEETVRVRK